MSVVAHRVSSWWTETGDRRPETTPVGGLGSLRVSPHLLPGKRVSTGIPTPTRHRSAAVQRVSMPARIRVLLLLLLLLLVPLLGDPVRAGRVKKKATRSRPCVDLPEEILEQMFGRLSVGVLSAFHHTLQLEPLETLNLTCPDTGRTRPGTKTRTPVNLLSLSPWAYRISHDPARYPRYIPEAYCLCKGCLTGPYGEESDRYRSTPVYTPSVILRRTGSCVGGRHSYTETYVSIAVGCTCVPLLEKDRDARSSNQSLDREQPKNRQLTSMGKQV